MWRNQVGNGGAGFVRELDKFSIYNGNPQEEMAVTAAGELRRRLRLCGAGMLALVLMAGCKVAPRATAGRAAATTGPVAKPAQGKAPAVEPTSAELKSDAAEAGTELKSSIQQLKESISDDDRAMSAGMVNINYATQQKLATLPGISKAEAREIINNRPYNTPLDLVYKKVITMEEYDRLVNRVVAWDNLWTKTD